MFLNPDRSEDLELKIKVLDSIQIGDWERYNISQEEENEQGAQEVAIGVAEAVIWCNIYKKIREEEDEVEISITCASLQSATQPSKNLYFLENEAGEFDSDIMDTGDSDDEVSERWDTDEDEDEDEDKADQIML
jgi:hypothetical protein